MAMYRKPGGGVYYGGPHSTSSTGMTQRVVSYNNQRRGARPAKRDWWSEINRLIYTLETTRSQFFTTLTIHVYANRVTLVYRPFIGAGETAQTYNASDVGNVYANKSRKAATVGACLKNSSTPLFEVKRLKHSEAEKLKEALEKMIAFNQLSYRM
ncbi:hypothetical protein GF389_03100 [Candidatus Dojkabacteria bacterium]|nr:hypothetical protein [Candidatus Dojkabacteria bacterium]